jgi:hypothetical protein
MWRCVGVVLTDVSEERRLTQDLHSDTSQKTTFFIVTAVKAWNLTNEDFNWRVIAELENILKEAVVAESRYYPNLRLEGLRKTVKCFG